MTVRVCVPVCACACLCVPVCACVPECLWVSVSGTNRSNEQRMRGAMLSPLSEDWAAECARDATNALRNTSPNGSAGVLQLQRFRLRRAMHAVHSHTACTGYAAHGGKHSANQIHLGKHPALQAVQSAPVGERPGPRARGQAERAKRPQL
eukprot:10895670-Alexandrium_andersonii.AAC.1